jgi:hypothetical protein
MEYELELHFEGAPPRLGRTRLIRIDRDAKRHSKSAPFELKDAGVLSQSAGLQAFAIFMIRCSAYGCASHLKNKPPEISGKKHGKKHSLVQALAEAIYTAPAKSRWLHDILKSDQGQLDPQDIFQVANKHIKDVPVTVRLNTSVLRPDRIHVYVRDQDRDELTPLDDYDALCQFEEEFRSSLDGERIEPDPRLLRNELKVHGVPFDSTELMLLALGVRKHYGDDPTLIQQVTVDLAARLGSDKHKLYRLQVKDRYDAIEHMYARVGEVTLIEEELASRKRCIKWDEVAPKPWDAYDPEKKSGVLAFMLTPNDAEPAPLAHYLDASDSEQGAVLVAVRGLYNSLDTACPTARKGRIRWFDAYDRYLRWDETELAVHDLFRSGGDKPFQVDGVELPSPYTALKAIRDHDDAQVSFRQVHGDFHQRNVILLPQKGARTAKNDKLADAELSSLMLIPQLIDFRWAREFHWLVDYTLLEASLKVFHFGRRIPDGRYLAVSRMLDGKPQGGDSRPIAPAEARLIELIEMIRNCAQEEAKRRKVRTYDFNVEYAFSSLLVTMGMLSIPQCDMWKAWLTGGIITARLYAEGMLMTPDKS